MGELRVELAGPSWDPMQVDELRGALVAALEAGTDEDREIVQRVIVDIEVDAGRWCDTGPFCGGDMTAGHAPVGGACAVSRRDRGDTIPHHRRVVVDHDSAMIFLGDASLLLRSAQDLGSA